jgi:hypothetical protein
MFLLYINDSDPPTHVRSNPTANSSIIGNLDNATVVTAKQILENGWFEVALPTAGYIHGNLLRPNPPQIHREMVGSIKAWQHLLNGCGYHPNNYPQLVITGEFDAETIAVTKHFQRDMKLDETGDVSDIRTWQAAFDHTKLTGWLPIEPPILGEVEPPTNNLTESEKYDYCRQVILSHGGNFREGTNQRNLLSFRKETSTKTNDWKGLYDDLTVMLWKDGNGHKHYRQYQSNTEPSSWFEDSSDPRSGSPVKYGVQAGGDSRKDLGCLPEGYYTYRVDQTPDDFLGWILYPTQDAINVVRDIDHDGVFETHEPTASAGDSMLFHAGLSWRTGSAGCQTMRPDVYASFWDDLTRDGGQGTIGYTIVRWRSLS